MRNEIFNPLMTALNEVEFPSNEVTAKAYKFLEKLDEQLADAGFDPNTDTTDAAEELQDSVEEYFDSVDDNDDDDADPEDE